MDYPTKRHNQKLGLCSGNRDGGRCHDHSRLYRNRRSGRVGTVGGNTVYAIRVGSLHPSPRARTTKPQTRVGSRVQRRPCGGTRHAWRSLPKRERTHLNRERTQDLRSGSGSWGGPDRRRAQGRRQRRVMTRYTNLSPSEVPVDNRRGPGRGTLGASRANGSSQLTPNIRR